MQPRDFLQNFLHHCSKTLYSTFNLEDINESDWKHAKKFVECV